MGAPQKTHFSQLEQSVWTLLSSWQYLFLGAGCCELLSQSVWFGSLCCSNEAVSPSGTVNWYQTCLVRKNYSLVHRLATTRLEVNSIGIRFASKMVFIVVERVAHPTKRLFNPGILAFILNLGNHILLLS